GELWLVEQRPRVQSRGHAVAVEQGAGVVFATRERPARGARGAYRVTMRHGVSTITSGARMSLGIIFHDAKYPPYVTYAPQALLTYTAYLYLCSRRPAAALPP